MNERSGGGMGRLLFGLILLSLGFLWTLDNFGVLDSRDILRWWPGLLILIGAWRMTGLGGRNQLFSGFLLMTAGTLLVLREADVIRIRFWDLWPIFLMLIGASVVVRAIRPRDAADSPDKSETMSLFTMMGGIGRKSESQAFRGGDVTAIMAGAEIDLRKASAQGRDVVIDIFTWWGGVDIFVPSDWQVVSEVTPLLGAFEDLTRPTPSTGEPTRLILRGLIVMGGVDVKN